MEKKTWLQSDSIIKRSLAVFGLWWLGYLMIIAVFFIFAFAFGLLSALATSIQ